MEPPGNSSIEERIATLIAALEDGQVSVRWNAARELARLGPAATPALPALDALLPDRDATSALWARYAIAQITGETGKHLPAFIAALADSRVWPGMAAFAIAGFGPAAREAVPALIAELTADHPDNRWSAAGAFAAIGPDAREAVPALIASLEDLDEKVRWYAAWALGAIGPDAAPAVPALISALDDADDDVQGYAARALGRIGHAARVAIPHLEPLLATENPAVQAEVEAALQSLRAT